MTTRKGQLKIFKQSLFTPCKIQDFSLQRNIYFYFNSSNPVFVCHHFKLKYFFSSYIAIDLFLKSKENRNKNLHGLENHDAIHLQQTTSYAIL